MMLHDVVDSNCGSEQSDVVIQVCDDLSLDSNNSNSNNSNDNIINLKISKENFQTILKHAASHKLKPENVLQSALNDYSNKLRAQQQDTSSFLLYEGKQPRGDVLSKLGEISKSLIDTYGYPQIPLYTLQAIIKHVLGPVDGRTIAKYYRCILDFTKKTAVNTEYNKINVEFLDRAITELELKKLSSED